MMAPLRVLLCLCLGLLLGSLPSSPEARRLPEPGGSITLELNPALHHRFLALHQSVPLLELSPPDSPTSGQPPWSSALVESITPSPDYRTWTLFSRGKHTPKVRDALRECLSSPSRGTPRWPREILDFLNITHSLKVQKDSVHLTFNRPVGPLPQLLAGCRLPVNPRRPQGPFKPVGRGGTTLARNHTSPLPAPLLERVSLTAPGSPADIQTTPLSRTNLGVLVAPIPSVALLFQAPHSSNLDPLKLLSPSGMSRFYTQLGTQLLLSVNNEVHSRPTTTLLPSGIAPPRPLPAQLSQSRVPLNLSPLSEESPVQPLRVHHSSPLSETFAERLSVLLRHHGYKSTRVTAKETPPKTMHLLLWHAPTRDPALAILHLATEYRKRYGAPPSENPLTLLPQLLSEDVEVRLEAALTIEREWLTQRSIIPLANVSAWYQVHPNLRGLRIAPSGVPVLTDAFWSDQP